MVVQILGELINNITTNMTTAKLRDYNHFVDLVINEGKILQGEIMCVVSVLSTLKASPGNNPLPPLNRNLDL